MGDRARLNMTNTLLRGNKAAHGGGGIVAWGDRTVARVEQCTFEDNEAGRGGGFKGDFADAVVIIGCRFARNKAQTGAGIYAYG